MSLISTQAFYPIKPRVVDIDDGNLLVGACVFVNQDKAFVYMGDDARSEEQCHVYIMYYYEGCA